MAQTAQSVSMLQSLRSLEGIDGPFLIVAPLSTLPHWERELTLWTDLYWINFHGNADSRRVVMQYEWYKKEGDAPKGKGKDSKEVYRFQVLLCNYETVVSEAEALTAVRWRYMIVDEGHRLKNRNSRSLEVMSELRADRKLVLSGTPLQNHVGELWSMLNFLDKNKFGDADDFMRKFGSLGSGGGTAEQVGRLNKLLRPHLLRREKEDVEATLPGMKETLLYVEITNLQKMCYRAVLERNRELLLRGAGTAGLGPSFNNVSMMLRHCCNHPWLIPDVEEGALQQLDSDWEDMAREASERGLAPPAESQRSDRYNERLVQSSGKFVLLQKLLPKLKREGHRVLLFSQFTKVLDMFEDLFEANSWGYERIDGSITGAARQQAIDRFTDVESDSFVFILSTRAGGQGINLTAADTVIMFDPDWNPQNDVQAMARCHRIGQTKPVQVYKLCTKGTYENHMLKLANHKLGLEHAIMRTGEHGEKALTATGFAKTEKLGEDAAQQRASQIELLLRSGAHVLMDSAQDEQAAAFGQSSIEDILQHYVETVQGGEEGGEAAAGSSGGGHAPRAAKSTFAAATVVSEVGGAVVSMDDPDFWSKMIPDDTLAKAADVAARQAGADRIRPAKVSTDADPLEVLKRSRTGETSGRVSDSAGEPQRKRTEKWTQEQLAALRELMLEVGHGRAPEAGAEGARAEALGSREARELRKACDLLLLQWIARAEPSVANQWHPLCLHTQSNAVVESLGEEPRPKAMKKDSRFSATKGQLMTAAGGHPRPSGRAPSNDQGNSMTWSYGRGCWVDCTAGCRGTKDGVPQRPGEREEVLAENAALEVKSAEVEEQLYEEWLKERSGEEGEEEAEPARGAVAAVEAGAAGEAGEAGADGQSAAPPGGGGVAGEGAEEALDEPTARALKQLEQRVRIPHDKAAAEWLAADSTSDATQCLQRLLEHRARDDAGREDQPAGATRTTGDPNTLPFNPETMVRTRCSKGSACKHRLGASQTKWRFTNAGVERTSGFVCSACGSSARLV